MDRIFYYILSIPAILLALTVHEYAHGYVAYKLGDNTAKIQGRLSLNPIKHLDPIGAVFLLLFRFGWAKPVPINPRNFKNAKKGFAITAIAGPTANLILAFLSAFLYLCFDYLFITLGSFSVIGILAQFFFLLHSVNVGLAIFNLIPIPPLDGSRLLSIILPEKIYFGIMRYERKIYLGFMSWLILGSFISQALIAIPFISNSPLLSFLAHCLSLSDIIVWIASAVSSVMIEIWKLIPFLNV